MNSFQYSRIVPYRAKLIHNIIMDIEKYPEFLPWCNNATILSQEEEYLTAELSISFKNISQSYVSRVSSSKSDGHFCVKATAISGPFKYLNNIWQINSINNGSEIKFSIDFVFKSVILNILIGKIVSSYSEKIVDAFDLRARELS